MQIAEVKRHVLRDVPAECLEDYRNRGPYKNLRLNEEVRDGWISFTALSWNAQEQRLYLGLTAFNSDILYRFDPESGGFESLGFGAAGGDPLQVKIHRGLIPDGQGGYIFGAAGLNDADERNSAPGGGLYRFRDGKFTRLGIPVAHDYIQTIAFDAARQRVYGLTYPVLTFFDFDLATATTRYSLYTGSHFHSPAVDDAGYVWGSYQGRAGHCLFRYHPEHESPDFFDDPIPNLDPDHMFTFPLNGPIDSFINGGDGHLYFGSMTGDLYRLDPASGRSACLGNPGGGLRLAALIPGPDGRLLGSYGAYNETGLFLYDRGRGSFHDLGRVRDDDGVACFMVHDIAWDGGERVFAAETDTIDRSSYLWECRLTW